MLKLCDVISSQPHGLRFRYLISWGGLNALVWFEGRPRRDGAILFFTSVWLGGFSSVFGWEVLGTGSFLQWHIPEICGQLGPLESGG